MHASKLIIALSMCAVSLAQPIHYVTNTKFVAKTVFVGESADTTTASAASSTIKAHVVTVTRIVNGEGQTLPQPAPSASSSTFLAPAAYIDPSASSSSSSASKTVEVYTVTPSSSSSSSSSSSTSTTEAAPTTTSSSSAKTEASSTSSTAAAKNTGDSDFASAILAKHNEYRAKHGVDSLEWDSTLEEYAANYAAKFDCGSLVHSGGQYGENLALGYSTTGAVDAWYSEGDSYDYSAASVLDHFTQVIWKDSTKLGCASKYCNSYWGTYIVCEYDPAGNIVGEALSEVLPLES